MSCMGLWSRFGQSGDFFLKDEINFLLVNWRAGVIIQILVSGALLSEYSEAID